MSLLPQMFNSLILKFKKPNHTKQLKSPFTNLKYSVYDISRQILQYGSGHLNQHVWHLKDEKKTNNDNKKTTNVETEYVIIVSLYTAL